jgi:hypothetical protein
MNRNGTAAIAGFGPVERDSKIRTTGSARHARVDITHGTPAKKNASNQFVRAINYPAARGRARGEKGKFCNREMPKIDMETTYWF